VSSAHGPDATIDVEHEISELRAMEKYEEDSSSGEEVEEISMCPKPKRSRCFSNSEEGECSL